MINDEFIPVTFSREILQEMGLQDERIIKIPSNWDYEGKKFKSVKIDDKTFYNFNNLEKVILPDSMEDIGISAFAFCSSLEEIKLPQNIKRIRQYTFDSCTSLEKIIIPEGVEVIEKNAFWQCKNLKKVILPKTLEIIQDNAFLSCNNLEIIIPENVKKIGYKAFGYVQSIYYNGVAKGAPWGAYNYYDYYPYIENEEENPNAHEDQDIFSFFKSLFD